MRTIALVTLLLFSACKKKEDKPAAPADPKAGDTPAAQDAPVVAAEPPDAAPPDAAVVEVVTIADAKDYDAKATVMTDKIVAMISGSKGKDCDTLATTITAFADENRAMMDALTA